MTEGRGGPTRTDGNGEIQEKESSWKQAPMESIFRGVEQESSLKVNKEEEKITEEEKIAVEEITTTNNVVEKTKERMNWRQLIERAGKS